MARCKKLQFAQKFLARCKKLSRLNKHVFFVFHAQRIFPIFSFVFLSLFYYLSMWLCIFRIIICFLKDPSFRTRCISEAHTFFYFSFLSFSCSFFIFSFLFFFSFLSFLPQNPFSSFVLLLCSTVIDIIDHF